MLACYNNVIVDYMGIVESYARDHINHQFGRWVHGILEKVDDNRVETFSESREASECLLYANVRSVCPTSKNKNIRSFGVAVQGFG